MKTPTRSLVWLYAFAALYDGLLGLAFLFAPAAIFQHFAVPPPNHFGYVHFPAAVLLIFTLMFSAIARNPSGNRNLIPYGILLKLAYSGVVLFHAVTAGVPYMWKPFAVCDLIFMALFCWSYLALRQSSPGQEE